MKQHVFFKMAKELKERPNFMRKIKIFALVGVVGFFIVATVAIWAGVSAVKYVAERAQQAVQAPSTQAQVARLKDEIKGLPTLQPLNCWGQAQSLMSAQPWLERPALENLKNLKGACFEQKPNPCEGPHCDRDNLMKDSKGSTI